MTVVRLQHVMGMPILVDVRDTGVGEEAADRVFAWFDWVDATFSTYRPESEISRIGRGELSLADAHPRVREIIARCEELREETHGYFDVHAASPERLDPSGLVKGWAVDGAAAMLADAGARNYAVDAGGDMRIRGGALPEPQWRVGIQHPLERDKVAVVTGGSDLAVATSGAYNRGDHVLDPHTRSAPHGVLSVTVTGPDLATADAFATAAFAMGEMGPHWTADLRGYEALTILANGTIRSTAGFPRLDP